MTGPYLIFELASPGERLKGPDCFALDVSTVLGVVEADDITAVPLAPSVIDGIINHNGRIVTIFDPAPILGLPAQPKASSVVVMLRRPDGGGNVGLRVSRIREIVAKQHLAVAGVPAGGCVDWVAQRDSRLIHVIQPAPFVAELNRRFGREPDAERRRQGASP
jgi:chemotaxis signal transduction protein